MLINHVNEIGGAELSNKDTTESSPLSDSNDKWSESTTKLLLETFKKIDNGKTVVKNKWAKIAQQVNEVAGTHFSAEKCRLKIKTIQDKLMRDKKKNSLSGGQRVPIDPQVEEIFSTCPDVVPVCTLDSENSSMLPGTEPSHTLDRPSTSAVKSSNSSATTLISSTKAKRGITLSLSVLPSPSTDDGDSDSSEKSDLPIGRLTFQTVQNGSKKN